MNGEHFGARLGQIPFKFTALMIAPPFSELGAKPHHFFRGKQSEILLASRIAVGLGLLRGRDVLILLRIDLISGAEVATHLFWFVPSTLGMPPPRPRTLVRAFNEAFCTTTEL